MSKIKSHLYELYLIEEEQKGNTEILSEEDFYEQYNSSPPSKEKEELWYKGAYEAYKEAFKIILFVIGEPITFELFKKEIEMNGQIIIDTLIGDFVLKAKR